MLRNIYYALSPSMRLWVRKLVYLPLDLFRSKNDLIPPQGLIYTGRGDFIKVGKYWTGKFIKEGGLKPEHIFLDIGSGIGRIAVGLTDFLRDGQYEGFDAVQQGVNWCKKHISTKYPNFNFTYADLSNDLYKSSGSAASNFSFPYETNSFDFAASISVFTHMLPDEIENYLFQSNKVLKPGGVLLATFFIVDKKYQPVSDFSFPFDYGHYRLMDKTVKSANVALEENYLMEMCNKAGFELISKVPGYWQQHIDQQDNDFQDYLILKKAL